MDEEFLNDTKYKAINIWKWRSPLLVAILTFIHPFGILLTSIPAFFIYFLMWFYIYFYWQNWTVGILLCTIFSVFAFINTRWKNGAIEKWKYDLPGTGMQNPKKFIKSLIDTNSVN